MNSSIVADSSGDDDLDSILVGAQPRNMSSLTWIGFAINYFEDAVRADGIPNSLSISISSHPQ